MNKLIQWFAASNRYKHLIGGFIIAAAAPDIISAVYAVILVAAALEFKDRQWGGRFDWVDLAVTVGGGVIGIALRLALRHLST